MKKNVEKQELSPFEEALWDTIKEWNEEGINPLESTDLFREYAIELLSVALDPIPCWQRVKAGPFAFENGLHKTQTGIALVHDGYFVMLEDLVARLPRELDEL